MCVYIHIYIQIYSWLPAIKSLAHTPIIQSVDCGPPLLTGPPYVVEFRVPVFPCRRSGDPRTPFLHVHGAVFAFC